MDINIAGKDVSHEILKKFWLEILKLIKNEPTAIPIKTGFCLNISIKARAAPDAGQRDDAKPGGIANIRPN